MAVEAVTAGLCLTGLVHADPHEGNIMRASTTATSCSWTSASCSPRRRGHLPREACFGRPGIQCVLAADYVGLVQAFQDTGFVGTPINWREKDGDAWQDAHPSGKPLPAVMAEEVERRMSAAPETGSRFGALPPAVLGDMGFTWYMFTPPYIILLTRTFLTLEGIANQVDPAFNVYEVALPWAVRRALAPSTVKGAATLRSSILTEDGTFQWGRIDDLVEEATADNSPAPAPTAETMDAPASGRGRLMAAEAAQAKPQFEGADAAAQSRPRGQAGRRADDGPGLAGGRHVTARRARFRRRRIYYSVWRAGGTGRRGASPPRDLSAAIDAWWTKTPVATEPSAVAWPRSSDALAATRGNENTRGGSRDSSCAATPAASVGRHARPARDGGPRVGGGARVRRRGGALALARGWRSSGDAIVQT